jgi:hypothetical protein
MKSMCILCLTTNLIFACNTGTDYDLSEVNEANKFNSGTRLVKFAGSTLPAILFVDAEEKLVSVHSLDKDLDLNSPEYVQCLTTMDSVDEQKMNELVQSNEHYIWVAEVDLAYADGNAKKDGICCILLKKSTVTYTGTGFLECNNDTWCEAEVDTNRVPGENDYTDLAKSSADFVIFGMGTVSNTTQAIHYEVRCNMTLDFEEGFEEDNITEIQGPTHSKAAKPAY